MTDLDYDRQDTGEALPGSEDSVNQYMKDIRQYPRLTLQQEQELAMGCAAGDQEAIRQMVSSNLQLVVSIAREYAGRGVPLLDLIQEGSIGLIAAAKKFDPARQLRFSTYATKWIRQGVARCVMDHSCMIRVPYYTAQRMNKVLRVRNALLQQTGVEPDAEEIAVQCDMEPEKVLQLLSLAPQVYSLDAPVGQEGENELQSLVEDLQSLQPQEELVRRELKATIDRLLCMLTPRQQQVLELRYGLENSQPMSQEQASKILGISKERVRQIEHEAMAKLKKMGADFGLEDFLL